MSQDEPLLAYFGHHKCATQWTRSIVEALCDRVGRHPLVFTGHDDFDDDLPGAIRDPTSTFLCYLNAERRFVRRLRMPLRAFHLVRDPRDIVVSAYFSHLHSHPLFGDLETYRQALQARPQTEGILLELERRAPQFDAMLRWNYGHPDILELRMEDVTTDPETHLGRIAGFLGLGEAHGVTTTYLAKLAQKHSFDVLSGGRAPGVEDRTSHLRKGVAGDWANHFEPVHVAYMKEHYGELLKKLGYETSDEWG